MLDEIKQLNTAFAEFKQANNEAIAEVKKGFADVVTTEKVDRINDHISDMQEKISTLEAKNNRLQVGGQQDPEQAEHSKAFGQFLRKGNEDALKSFQKKAMSVGSDPDGGYLVPVNLSSDIIKTQFETSPFRQYANAVTITTDAIEFLVDKDDVTSAWVGETDERAETSTPQFAKIRIPVNEMYAEPRITQKLLDDSVFNVEQWLAEKVADRFARVETAAFIKGNGTNQPKGFLTYPAGTTWGTIEQLKTGANGAFASSKPADAIFDLVYALKAAYRAGAAFMFARPVEQAIRKIQDSTGQYLWQPSLTLGTPATILGYPVVAAEDMPTIATGSLSVAFGNFQQGYTIVDRTGITVLRDPFTAKPYIKFYTTKRVGGDVTNFEAIKLLSFAA